MCGPWVFVFMLPTGLLLTYFSSHNTGTYFVYTMYTEVIQQEKHSNQQPNTNTNREQSEQYRYQRKYPKFSSVRLSHENISRIKNRANRYSQTIDDLVTIILGQLDYYEKLGYPDVPQNDGGSW